MLGRSIVCDNQEGYSSKVSFGAIEAGASDGKQGIFVRHTNNIWSITTSYDVSGRQRRRLLRTAHAIFLNVPGVAMNELM